MLSKAELILTPSNAGLGGGPPIKLPLQFNPAKIDVSRGLKLERAANTGGNRQSSRVGSIAPITLKLNDLVFDTYEERSSVRTKVIDHLEDAVCRGKDKRGEWAMVRFNWGRFSESRHDDEYQFVLKGFDCSYTMFLPDGTPVRATVTLKLEQYVLEDTQSPKGKAGAEAHIHQVRRGETAQSIATRVYGDPSKWRAICDANNINAPMAIGTGTQLLVPAAPSSPSPTPRR